MEKTEMSDSKKKFYIESIEKYLVYRGELTTDGYIGIPVGVSTYIKDREAASKKTPLIFYVVGTLIERIGTDSDEVILNDLIERGYLVSVLNYYSDPRTVSPRIDFSIQTVKTNIWTREEFKREQLAGVPFSPIYVYNMPSGYNIARQLNFWSIDRHGADGSLDFIMSVWNNDFVSVKGDRIITFPDGRQMTVREYTESLPGGKVTDISQCIRSDGSYISFDLNMDILYPTSPKNKVPVLLYAQSSQDTVGTWKFVDRPHATGYLNRGYALALYDYPFIPMARTDHYGYFDGDRAPGHKTGDNYTYSVGKPNDTLSSTAAQRFVRHLADVEGEKFRFDTDHVGIMGISKTGNTLRMAHPDPTTIYEPRYFAGHHGETRYENGDTADRFDENGKLLAKGGEPQPWLTDSKGNPISSHAHFCSTSVGSATESINSDFSPIYCPGTMQPGGSYYSFWPDVASRCYTADVPFLGYVCPDLGHSFARGIDRDHGVDTYSALFDMADYNLRGAPAKCEYIVPKDASVGVSTNTVIQVKFNASIPESEIEKISIITPLGKQLRGVWKSSWGRTLWEFIPFGMAGSEYYTLSVPADLCADNGKPIAAPKLVSFLTAAEGATGALASDFTLSYGEERELVTTAPTGRYNVCKLRFGVNNDAANAIDVKLGGETVGTAYIGGIGEYDIDLTEIAKAHAGEEIKLSLSLKKKAGKSTAANLKLAECGSESVEFKAEHVITDEEGRAAVKITDAVLETKFLPYHSYYSGADVIARFRPLGALTPEDLGRRFVLKLELYDTVSRQISINVGYHSKEGEIDLKAVRANRVTRQGEWQTLEVPFSIDEERHVGVLDRGFVSLFAEQHGAASPEKPFYVSSLELEETVTDVDLTAPRLIWRK